MSPIKILAWPGGEADKALVLESLRSAAGDRTGWRGTTDPACGCSGCNGGVDDSPCAVRLGVCQVTAILIRYLGGSPHEDFELATALKPGTDTSLVWPRFASTVLHITRYPPWNIGSSVWYELARRLFESRLSGYELSMDEWRSLADKIDDWISHPPFQSKDTSFKREWFLKSDELGAKAICYMSRIQFETTRARENVYGMIWKSSQRRRFRRIERDGCCGSFNWVEERWSPEKQRMDVYLLGFNHGH